MSPRQPGEHHDILLLKLKTVEPLIKCREEKISQIELDLLKATALHPFDPAEQALFLSRAEIRPGEFTPSHSLIVADLEQAARCLGDEYAEEKKRASEEFWGRHLAVVALNRQGAGPEALGPFVVEFLRASAALIRVGLQPALHLRRQLLDRLERPEPVKLDGELTGQVESERTGKNINQFRLRGDDWTVRFMNGEVFPLEANAGAAYVHHLLQKPGRAVAAVELAACWDRVQMSERQSPAAGEVEGNRSGDDGDVLDNTGLRRVEERLIRLEAESEEAKKNSHAARVAELDDERQFLTRERAKAKRPGGRRVLLGDQNRKITDRVTKAIQRTILAIRKKDPALGRHLKMAIRTGAVCVYAPEFPTRWEL